MTAVGSNSDARKRAGHLQAFVEPDPATTVPRIAESLDDLAVGMVVVWKAKDGSWVMPRNPLRDGNDVWDRAEQVVILADPPAPPAPDWLVPADAMKALREALRLTWPASHGPTIRAARAVLDAATEVGQ